MGAFLGTKWIVIVATFGGQSISLTRQSGILRND
jgi:hypothetical protein